MIGSGLKKLAKEHGMRVAKGVAYGEFRGYAATFDEGAGWKRIRLTLRFPDSAKRADLKNRFMGQDFQTVFRVRELKYHDDGVEIIFNDKRGTMEYVRAFVDHFFPRLDEAAPTKADICMHCGRPIVGGSWKLIEGAAYHYHEACADEVRAGFAANADRQRMEAEGTYLTGLAGALSGALLGGLAWALLFMLGRVHSAIGLLIGILAEKGYRKLHGLQGKGKILVLMAAILAGVLFGTILGYGLMISKEVMDAGMPASEIIPMIKYLLLMPEMQKEIRGNLIIALWFGALGSFIVIWNEGKKLMHKKMVNLD